jgi:SPP1 family predicted phage head-tail adaptor
MRAGSLRKRVTVQQRSTSVDSFGGQAQTWIDICTVWAEIRTLNGRELMAASAMQSEVSHEITVRYRSELTNPKAVAAMRILFKGRIFNIHSSVNVDERNEIITLQVSEGVNNG